MDTLITIITGTSLLWATPFCMLAGLVGLSAVLFRKQSFLEAKPNQKIAVLIPAHNEESSIKTTLEAVKKLDYPLHLYDIVVIADNCSDNTAAVAEAEGARVMVRHHNTRRSKGYALEWAISQLLEENSYDAITIIDADTAPQGNMLRWFDTYLRQGKKWLQCYYTSSNPDSSWRTELLTYALSLINGTYSYGSSLIGLGSPLRGNGMCFSTAALQEHMWKAASLAEDMEFSWRLRLRGQKVTFVPETKVFGELVSTGGRGAEGQRQRWEEGRKILRKMFRQQIIQSDMQTPMKLAYIADLYMPPLVRLVMAMVPALVGLLLLEEVALLTLWAVSLVVSLAIYLASPIVSGFSTIKQLMKLVHLPRYMLWKLFVMCRKVPTSWVRTPREAASQTSNEGKVRIGKIAFDRITYEQATIAVVEAAKSGSGGLVVTPNVAHVLQAEKDERFHSVVAQADFVFADGVPVIWASKLLGNPLPDKISGSDFIYDLCKAAGDADQSVFFLGGMEGEAEQAAENLQKLYPKLKVAGTYFPEFGFEKDDKECQQIVDTINQSGASIVFVGVGCPKQEYWTHKYGPLLPGKVLLGIGISISFCAGNTARAPRWMQKSGLEWLFRFCQEPRRLGLRYLCCFMFPWIVWQGRRRGEVVTISPTADKEIQVLK